MLDTITVVAYLERACGFMDKIYLILYWKICLGLLCIIVLLYNLVWNLRIRIKVKY